MHNDAYIAYIGGRSKNNIKCVVHDDLGWKNRTTRYIMPRHWIYEWFSQFRRWGTYSVLSLSPSIHSWDTEIRLFSNLRPSAILNFRKLQFWSHDLYRHMILHLCSEFRFDQPIWRQDIAEERFSIWRLSAILDLLWRNHIASKNCILCSQLCIKFSGCSVA